MKLTFITAAICCVTSFLIAQDTLAQIKPRYVAPQDTIHTRRDPGLSLNKYSSTTVGKQTDTRLLGAALKAARMLSDTASYDQKQGIAIMQLFSQSDLDYIVARGIENVVALFEEINKQLPAEHQLDFLTTATAQKEMVDNPFVLNSLRLKIGERPAGIDADREQWKDNVYYAYMARDYGTRLENTITITSATRELRERPDLTLIDSDGSPVRLNQLLQRQQSKGLTGSKAEQAAVREFRMLTYPNQKIVQAAANENYRRALLALIELQAGDFRAHSGTQQVLNQMSADLAKGEGSIILTALKSSSFFDRNVPGNLGPVLLTEYAPADPRLISEKAAAKAMELLTLTALHYGERDAVKLFSRLLDAQGNLPADSSGDFSSKRLAQLKYHGVEKFKSLGFGPDKTADMRIADLVLVAVASPALPENTSSGAYLKMFKAGQSVMASYSSTEINESRSVFLLGPRISLGSRHTEYIADNDPVKFANNALVSQNGFEFRLESDLYFSNPAKLYDRGLKPFLYPEFGIIFGLGKRKVGYGEHSYQGPHGAVPQFKQNYSNWGGHAGLNVGPVLVAMDATVLSTPNAADPYQRFFDLSQSMTYYRYSFLLRMLNLGLGKAAQPDNWYLSLDLEMAGETNNEGTLDRTRTQDGGTQIGGKEWQRAYQRARPNGIYNQAIATQMILDGDVKAAYPSANYAAAHIGIQREAFQLKFTAGLYNLRAIEGYRESKGEWMRKLLKNTMGGNGFAAASLTYNFGWKGRKESRRKLSKSSMYNGVATGPEIEESSASEKISGGLRSRALIMNRR